MKDLIEKYKVTGKVYLWTYKDNSNNYPGWNFTLDNKASESLVELLDLMKECAWSSKNKISLQLPTTRQISVPNNWGGKAEWKTKTSIIFSCRKTESPDHWHVSESDNSVEIQFGISKLTELRDAIIGIPLGKGDHALSNKDDESILYFWWNIEKQ